MGSMPPNRWEQRGTRPVKVANCSGCMIDPPYQMRWQATMGDVDFITGDYLGEGNIGDSAMNVIAGTHEGFEKHAYEAIKGSLDVLDAKKIKVILNGGNLNPKLLAERVQELVTKGNYDLKVAYVEGDNRTAQVKADLAKGLPPHLDAKNDGVSISPDTFALANEKTRPVISAVAYLGAREIIKGLENGADIIVTGRVADASPVIAAAWWWHGWKDTSYDELAGALLAGHLIECASYVTGANYCAFYEHDPDQLIDLPYGIVEIEKDGSCIATKHEGTKGIMKKEVILCQIVYELQGNIYLNSDVKAYLDDIKVEDVGPNRVRVSGVRGAPPPPTTKLAVFYKGGYQCEIVGNATGYATKEKWALWERLIRFALTKNGVINDFEKLEFQVIGAPADDPQSQLESTTSMRIFAQANDYNTCLAVVTSMGEFAIQHFSGHHASFDGRTAIPKPTHHYYPATILQDELHGAVNLLDAKTGNVERIDSGHPSKYEVLEPRPNYDTANPIDLSTTGPTKTIRLGDIVLARSGDKGANVNIGLFVRKESQWDWLRSFLTRQKMIELIGKDWQESYHIERVEFPNVWTVHFVVYGILGRGVCGSARLDALGKGFADYIRYKKVEVPEKFL